MLPEPAMGCATAQHGIAGMSYLEHCCLCPRAITLGYCSNKSAKLVILSAERKSGPQNSGIIAGKGTSGAGEVLGSETLLAGVSASLSVHRYSSTRLGLGLDVALATLSNSFGGKRGIMVELGCSSALELLPPYPEVDVHGQPSLLSNIVI